MSYASEGRSARYRGAEPAIDVLSASQIDIGIDLGTRAMRIVDASGRLLVDEPSVCCFRGYDAVPAVVAVGAEAHPFVGKAPKPLKIIHPLKDGVLSDMNAARELLIHARKTLRQYMRRRRLRTAIGIPTDATQAEQRALITAALDGGFAQPVLVPEPLLAAAGLGFDVREPRGRMVMVCGAGTTQVAVISLGGVCASHTWRGGGLTLDRAVIDHLHLNHRFEIGAASAEQLKLSLSRAFAAGQTDCAVRVAGLDLTSGLPKTFDTVASEFTDVWRKFTDQVCAAARAALAETPPELSRDIIEDGIHLTGGGARVAGLAAAIERDSGVAVRVPEDPLATVVEGFAPLIRN